MIGEMRDLETTEIAVRAALTGHLVFSTLHTNDAIGGITRLIDMGVEPFLVSSAVRAFFAQRLVRKLCPLCKTPTQVEESYLKSIGFPSHLPGQIMRGVGCEACRGSGFQGRLSIYEVCLVTHALQHLINSRAHPAEFHKQAIKDGYIPMRGYGFQKVLSGETTIEEVLSVTAADRNHAPQTTQMRSQPPRRLHDPLPHSRHSMPTFVYSAHGPSGLITGELRRRIAARRLHCWGKRRSSRSSLKWPVMRNLLPRPLRRRSKTHRYRDAISGTPIKLKLAQVVLFVEELADLVGAGIQLEPALATMERRRELSGIKTLATVLRGKVRDGMSFSKAVAATSPSFGKLFCALVSAGEASGSLSTMLEASGAVHALLAGAEVQSALRTALSRRF
jgi:hypothetical protein